MAIIFRALRHYIVFSSLLLLALVIGLTTPFFWTSENLANVFSQAAIPILLAIGAAFVIATNQIDLSVGSIVAVGALTCGAVANATGSTVTGVAAACVAGAVCGCINGGLSALIPSFIATLATMGALRGLALTLTDAQSINLLTPTAALDWHGLSVFVPCSMSVCLVSALTFSRTRFGLRLLAVGSNEDAARNLGLSVEAFRLAAFCISGLLAGLAGSFLLLRLGAARPTAGLGYELDAITTALVGGTVLSGGKVSIVGALTAAILFSMIRNSLTLLSVSPSYQEIAVGIILAAVVLAQVSADRGLRLR